MSVESNVHLEAARAGEAPVRKRRRGVWAWLAISLLFAAIGLTVAAYLMLKRATPILKGRVIETLSTRFNSRVELDVFHVSVTHGLDVTGQGLRIFPPDDVVAAGAKDPLIAVHNFDFHAGLRGLFVKPTHIGTVNISGMTITIPPRQIRQQGQPSVQHKGKIKILVDDLIFNDSRLILQNFNPNKDPKVWILQHIVAHDFGPYKPLHYDALLSNAIPRGEIHATGNFGPWNTESPGDSSITGSYTFEHADLNTIKGISGILHSAGEFSGQLDRIEVTGATDTPDFSLDTAEHPMPLHTTFHAIVDGLSGDTYLTPVIARLGRSDFTCSGAIINIRGKGHIINLDVHVPNGRIEDFLRLAVKSREPIMTGRLTMNSRLNIPPGKESVSKKIELKSGFTLREIHFTDPKTEDKLDEMSLRAQGRPKEAQPGAPDIHSVMSGDFVMRSGQMDFSKLNYTLPGATILLAGHYAIASGKFDFAGDVRTEAKLSQMVASRWKSWLLKPVDPFFHKDGAGALIPIKVTGTRDNPDFSLDLHRQDPHRPAAASH
jgi:hypothetical protein